MLPEFGSPQTLDEWIMYTQEAQATMMRYAVEVYRRRMFETSGSLIWQYNEPWPAVTFSLVDFFGRPKAAYYWVRHVHAPVIGILYTGNGPIELWGVSDLPEAADCTVCLQRIRHDGAILGEATVDGRLGGNQATQLLRALPAVLQIASPEDEMLRATLRCGDHMSECIHHDAPRKNWRLPAAAIEATVRRVDGDCVAVELRADAYVHWANVSVADPRARYSDNFVDLLPGEPRTLEIRGAIGGEMKVASANAAAIHLAAQ